MPTPLPAPVMFQQDNNSNFVAGLMQGQIDQENKKLRAAELARRTEESNYLNQLRQAEAEKLRGSNILAEYDRKDRARKEENAAKLDVLNKYRLVGGLTAEPDKFETVYVGFSSLLTDTYKVPKEAIPSVGTFVRKKSDGTKYVDEDAYKTWLGDFESANNSSFKNEKLEEKVEWLPSDKPGEPNERWLMVNKGGHFVKHKKLALSPKEEAEIRKTNAEATAASTKGDKFKTVTYYDEDGRLVSASIPAGETVKLPAGSRLPSEVPEKTLSFKEREIKAKTLLNQEQSDELDIDAEILNNIRGTNTFYIPTAVKMRNKLAGAIDVGSAGESKLYKKYTIPKDPETGEYKPYEFFARLADKKGVPVQEVLRLYSIYVNKSNSNK